MSREGKWILIAAIALTTAISVLFSSGTDGVMRDPAPSTVSSAPTGCKAFYLLLEEFKLPVMRLRRSYAHLDRYEGVLVVVDPRRVRIGKAEMQRLDAWVKKGNRLIIFEGLSVPARAEESGTPSKENGSASYDSAPRNSPARHFGLQLRRFVDSSRTEVRVSDPGPAGVGQVSVSRAIRWRKASADWKTLLADDAGPIVVTKEVGAGEVTAVSDPTIVLNGTIDREMNGRFALALVMGKGKPPVILFDDYHHGQGISDGVGSYLASSLFGVVFLQGLIGGGLYFFSRRASRVGRYEGLRRERGRSPLEYVDSMAGIFDAAKAGHVALEAVLHRFLAGVSRKTAIPVADLESGRRDERVGNAVGGPDGLRLIRSCGSAVRGAEDPERCAHLAAQLTRLKEKLGSRRPMDRIARSRGGLQRGGDDAGKTGMRRTGDKMK